MRAAVARLWARLGYRGAILGAFGVLEVVYGIGIVTAPRVGILRGVTVLSVWAPMQVWGTVWIVCGAVALLLSVACATRDRWGYGIAQLPPTLWGLANAVAYVSGAFPQAYTSMVTWLMFSVILMLVNKGMVEGRRT